MSDMGRCESYRASDGKRCVTEPEFIVGIGERTIDEESACARHLSAACRAFIGADGVRTKARVRLITTQDRGT